MTCFQLLFTVSIILTSFHLILRIAIVFIYLIILDKALSIIINCSILFILMLHSLEWD